MRVARVTICVVLTYLLVPASGGLTADLVHLLESGHTRHADAGGPEAAAAEGEDDHGAHGDPGPEHGCSGPYHHCPCHSTLSFVTSAGVQPGPMPDLEAGPAVGHDSAFGIEHRRELERPPSA